MPAVRSSALPGRSEYGRLGEQKLQGRASSRSMGAHPTLPWHGQLLSQQGPGGARLGWEFHSEMGLRQREAARTRVSRAGGKPPVTTDTAAVLVPVLWSPRHIPPHHAQGVCPSWTLLVSPVKFVLT